jgi:plasmid stabilization system protein ParE
MVLSMEVVWSNNALLSAQTAADYARDEFGEFQVRKLREKIRLAVRRISFMPSACPLEQNLLRIEPTIQYRYITLFPHLEMIFHEEKEGICVIDLIWNTRRNPDSLKL